MKIKRRLLCLMVSGALVLPAGLVSASELPQVTVVSIQVLPQVAASSPGSLFSLDVRCEGVTGLGTQSPISVAGAPEGTSVEVLPQSEQYALVSLAFPPTAAKGRYSLTVKVESPEAPVEQTVEVEIGDNRHD